MRVLIVFMLAAALAMPVSLNAQATDGLGMWVWSESSFSTIGARQKLVRFCGQHGISHLDVHAKISREGGKPVLQNSGAFKDLVLLAGEHNITTAVLRGDSQMFFSSNHEQTLGELRAIIDFDETLPEHSLFRGIKYDVEPHGTKEWKAGGKARETVMGDYLGFLRKARSVLRQEAPRLWLAADLPYWWDEDEFIVEFEDRRQRFSEHVQDLADFIVIMSYWRRVEEVLASLEGERMYASRIRKIVCPSLETIRLKADPQRSFWGVPPGEFWKAVNRLQEVAKRDPALGGVMIHNYRGLVEKLHNANPDRPDAGETR